MKRKQLPMALLACAGFSLLPGNSATAATYSVDFSELSQSAVINEFPTVGFPRYEAFASDTLPDGGIFKVTAVLAEGVSPPVFSPTEIHLPERWGSISFNPPSPTSILAIDFSAGVSFFITDPSLSGVDDDYFIRVLRDSTEIYAGLAGGLSQPLIMGDSIQMPRQTIIRSGDASIGVLGRVSNITVHGVDVIPEPSSSCLLTLGIALFLKYRRRE